MDDHLLTRRPGLFCQVRDILVDPPAEWPRVAARRERIGSILLRYAAPLAAIGPIADLVGNQFFGNSVIRPDWKAAATAAATIYLLQLAALFLLAGIANLLAPRFGGVSNYETSFRVVAYSMTAGWVAGIFGLFPAVSLLELLGLYSIYLYYTGSRAQLNVPAENLPVFTAASFALSLAVFVGASMLTAALTL